MSRRTITSVVASVIIGIGCIATISTDAFAYRGGGRAGVGPSTSCLSRWRPPRWRLPWWRLPCCSRTPWGGRRRRSCCGRCCCLRRIRRCPLRLLSLSSLQLL